MKEVPMDVSVEEDNSQLETLREVDDTEIEKLHSHQLENLNGNLDKDQNFKGWHETVTVESTIGNLLHILPYAIIDF